MTARAELPADRSAADATRADATRADATRADASRPAGPTRPDGGHREADDQRSARAVVVALHGALRAVRLYPLENDAVQKALEELDAAVRRVTGEDGECEVRRAGDFAFVNETRLRLGLDNYAAVVYVLAILREAGIGAMRVREGTSSRAWAVLLAFLQAPPLEYPEEERLGQLEERLAAAGVREFEFEAPLDDAAPDEELDTHQRARQTYMRSLDVTREVMTQARLGRSPSLRKVKRAVQSVVDAILADPASLMGLTTLREFDEYTFVHSVNVCILSVALGRRLGFTKLQLLELGVAALMHDIGKSRVPPEVLNKRGQLTPEELEQVRQHTWLGMLALFTLPVGSGRPWRAMLGAFEHHLRIDCSGYPTVVRPRRLGLMSRIIAVADGFDAATTARVYRQSTWSPADVLLGMRDNPRLGFDPVLVKAFINLTGIYPVGTLVVLDSLELALVHAANPVETALSRPIVRLLTDAQGNRLADTPLVDLLARDQAGHYVRTIIRTDDPDRWGIRVAEYFA